jgi:hypothetical protein
MDETRRCCASARNDGSSDQPVGGNDQAKLCFVGGTAVEGDRCGDEAVGPDEVKTIGPQAGVGSARKAYGPSIQAGQPGRMISPAP